MNNNPFRSVPSTNVNRNVNVEDWGKTKFKPKKFGDGGKNDSKKRFGVNKTFIRKFNGNRETHHYNEVSNDAEPYNGTPWNKFKDELVYKQREDDLAALQSNMESNEAKAVLKKRKINYRKSLIQQKKQEPTEWEDFADDEQSYQNVTKPDNENGKPTINKKKKQKQFSKSLTTSSFLNDKSIANEFISKELLSNFDSKKLNYNQNDKLRKTITKATIMASGNSLKSVVKDLRKKKKNKEMNNI